MPASRFLDITFGAELLVSKFQDRNALLHARAGTEEAGNN
jgi:hypothetical protein